MGYPCCTGTLKERKQSFKESQTGIWWLSVCACLWVMGCSGCGGWLLTGCWPHTLCWVCHRGCLNCHCDRWSGCLGRPSYHRADCFWSDKMLISSSWVQLTLIHEKIHLDSNSTGINQMNTPDICNRVPVVLFRLEHGLKNGTFFGLFLLLFIVIIFHILIDCIHHHIRGLFVVLYQFPQLVQPFVDLLQLSVGRTKQRGLIIKKVIWSSRRSAPLYSRKIPTETTPKR